MDGGGKIWRGIGLRFAKHKSMFFSEKNAVGELIDYVAAVSGGLRLVPGDKVLTNLSLDENARRRAAV